MARPTNNENFALLSAFASQPLSPLLPITRRIADCGCNIVEARLSNLGDETVINALVVGSWDAIAKLETSIGRIERDDKIRVFLHRTLQRNTMNKSLPYLVECIAADKPGILTELAEFFESRGIAVESLTSSRYKAMHTGAEMFSAQLTIGIPANAHISTLREDFLDFCDHTNLDAILDPMKF